MTTVVAIAREGHVYMAADTATNIYERPVHAGFPKIIRLPLGDNSGDILLGFSGSGALSTLCAADLKVDAAPHSDADPNPWAQTVARAVTDIGVAAGIVEAGRLDAHVLLAWNGHLWTLVHMIAVTHHDGIAAIGSGEGPAIGAADALLGRGVDPAEALVEALHIAIHRDKHSDYPLQVEHLPQAPVVTL